jgi:transcriptional regulator with XRE-family HTH domain
MESKKTKEQKVIKVPKLKLWLLKKGINQKELSEKTSLSTNTINRIVNQGHATKSVIKLLSHELSITVEHMNDLLKETSDLEFDAD